MLSQLYDAQALSSKKHSIKCHCHTVVSQAMATYLYWCKIATIISKPSIVDAEEMNKIEWSVSLLKISFTYSLLGTRLAIISSTSRTSSRSSSWAFKCLIYVLFAIRYYLCPMLIPCTVDGSWTEESEFISIFKAIQIKSIQSNQFDLIEDWKANNPTKYWWVWLELLMFSFIWCFKC